MVLVGWSLPSIIISAPRISRGIAIGFFFFLGPEKLKSIERKSLNSWETI
jgi:hypothetical protein